MELFTRRKIIPSNLDDFELEKLMTFPKRKDADFEEYYLKEIFNKDHIQIGKTTSTRTNPTGLHDFEYDREKKELLLSSKLTRRSFGNYAYLLLLILPFLFSENVDDIKLKLIGATLIGFILISLLLILVLRFEAKEIERELIIRINYFRGTMN